MDLLLPTALALAFLVGAVCAVALTLFVMRRRRVADKGASGDVAAVTAVLSELDFPATLLDSTLTPVFANAAARDEKDALATQVFADPQNIREFRKVLATGAAYLRMPEQVAESGQTARVRAFRVDRGHVAVLLEDTAAAERLNAMRRDFVANVSHELKTPVAAIGLLAEALSAGADDPQAVAAFSESLQQESTRLSNLIRDIIDLSQAQSELQPEDREPVDLRELVRAEVQAHKNYASPFGIELQLEMPAETERPAIILGRKNALGTAISNLLSNALRYSPEFGAVLVKLQFGQETLAVSVIDNGPGIAPELQSRVFERFFRGDLARSRDSGGTGLGLSIVRHTMRGHGGEVTLQSTPGEGACFTLNFPLHDSAETLGIPAAPAAALSKQELKEQRSQLRDASRARAQASHTIISEYEHNAEAQQSGRRRRQSEEGAGE